MAGNRRVQQRQVTGIRCEQDLHSAVDFVADGADFGDVLSAGSGRVQSR
jgi:hypothetical protein